MVTEEKKEEMICDGIGISLGDIGSSGCLYIRSRFKDDSFCDAIDASMFVEKKSLRELIEYLQFWLADLDARRLKRENE
jgi:hypothetical protein